MSGASFTVAMWTLVSAAGGSPPLPPPPSAPATGRPWEKVTPDQEQAAKELFAQGNQELLEYRFEDAARDYRAALGHWDLPAIHYNLAVALRSLSNLLEAREHLALAVKYGPDGLDDPAQYQRARKDLFDVESELARIELKCDQEGAKVGIDERQDVFTCPNTREEWIRPGLHVIRIRMDRKGWSHPTEKKPTLSKGQKLSIRLKAYPDDEVIQTRTPLPAWMPWTVMGAGLAVAGGGGWLHSQARNQFSQYDAGIGECATQPDPNQPYLQPCSAQASTAFARFRQNGNLFQNAAIGSYIGGGVTLIAGVAFLYFNAPRPYPIDPEAGTQVAIVPVLGGGSGGAMLVASF